MLTRQKSSSMAGICIEIFQLTNIINGLTLRSIIFIVLEFSRVITNPYSLLSVPGSLLSPLVLFFFFVCLFFLLAPACLIPSLHLSEPKLR